MDDSSTPNTQHPTPVSCTDDNIRRLSDMEYMRTRPGMYIGRLGDGKLPEDGIYIFLKGVIDSSIDGFKMNVGDHIGIDVEDNLHASVRDYGYGIPQGKFVEAASVLNTDGKYDSRAFRESVGLNGVGVKAINTLSSCFEVKSLHGGKVRRLSFEKGNLQNDKTRKFADKNGTYIYFEPDTTLFKNYSFRDDIVEEMLRSYIYLDIGLAIMHNGHHVLGRHGLKDLLTDNMTVDPLYPIVYMKVENIGIAFVHTGQYGGEYYSFMNSQHTTQGDTHQTAPKEHIAKTIKEFFGKYEYGDIRNGLVAAIAVSVEEPVFESQTKIRLGSIQMSPDGESINKYMGDFIKTNVDNYLHIHKKDFTDILENKIEETERERKAMAGVTRLARERAKKANSHNRKLCDCRVCYCDMKNDRKEESSIFITEGGSASESITKSRDVNTQAVFSLRGKPLNCSGLTKKVVYENEELNFLQAALDIEDGLDSLRYNKVVIAMDTDIDGMHIRLLMITFFLQFFPELIKKGHIYVLQAPFFHVRNHRTKIKNKEVIAKASARRVKREKENDSVTRYCYFEKKRVAAINELGPDPEITQFKGLDEISSDEFAHPTGPDMRLEQVTLRKNDQVAKLLEYYMGKSTVECQSFIIDNLVIEEGSPEKQ